MRGQRRRPVMRVATFKAPPMLLRRLADVASRIGCSQGELIRSALLRELPVREEQAAAR